MSDSRRRGLIGLGVLTAAMTLPAEAARFRFEAESAFSHGVGRATSDGWSADPALDPAGWLLQGPGTTLLHRGYAEVRIRVKTPSPSGPNDRLLRLDVRDRATGQLLADREIRRQEFPAPDAYRTFILPFGALQGRTIDFDVWFLDIAPITVDWVEAVTDERPLGRFGVNAHVPDSPRIDRAAAAHLRVMRMDFNWSDMEPAPASWSFGPYDTAVDLALAHGQHVLATLAFTPDWATSGPPLTHPPDDMGDWFDFVYWTVDHFRGRVRYWSIWNEPNLTRFFTGTRGDYINMTIVAAQAIRQADPDSFVLGPELSDLSSADWDTWLDEVLKYCRSSIDIVAHHVYDDDVSEIVRVLEGPRFPWESPSVRDIMANNGMGDTPLWLTETGWTSATHGEQGQANRIQAILGEMLQRPWWAKTFIYELADPPGSGLTWGLLREDLSEKLSYGATWETALNGAHEAWILAAPGPGAANPPYVMAYTWDGLPAMWLSAYGATSYGARVASGYLDPAERELVLTGPGPGPIHGPQVRAFEDTAAPVSKVNFYAYGTLRYGVNVASGDVDGDGLAEILTGGGPGPVFGPHVRGWNFDGTTLAPIGGLSFFAYGTLRYGVNVAGASPDGDLRDEMLTGPGPSAAFGGQVRGFDFDGVRVTPLSGLSFFAFSAGSHGCEVAGADLDGDSRSEVIAAPGPAPGLGPLLRTFRYSGSSVSSYVSDVVPFTGSYYGARVASCELDGGGAEELAAAAGPDPGSVGSPAVLLSIPPSGAAWAPGSVPFTPWPAYSYGVSLGALRLD